MSDSSNQRYQLIERIGHGGMAVVHRAHDSVLERTVALKILHPHLAERADSRARFAREAKAVARLKHPHIVEVFDYASADSEQSYIVTEFVDGPTLRAFVDEHMVKHPETALLLMLPIVDALARAHLAGIIHRDVKPENIMIRNDGSPVLMDFGIAQMVDMPTLTATGTMLGSPAHMAPEVIDGTEIGAPADIFSVGTTLYWLISGALPFSGPNPSALFRRILETDYVPIIQRRPLAGRQIAQLIDSCLAKDPKDRPTAKDLHKRIKRLLIDIGINEFRGELRTYNADPAVYEEQLTNQIIPKLLEQAYQASATKNIGLCVDLLDRIFILHPEHGEAKALLKKVERSQTIQRTLFMAAIIFCGLLPLFVGGWFFMDTNSGRELFGTSQSVQQKKEQTKTISSDAAPVVMDVSPIQTVDAGQARDGSTPQDAARELDTNVVNDSKDSLIQLFSAMRGVRVYVGGRAHDPPDLDSIRRSGGLQLPVGRHLVTFYRRGCKTMRTVIKVGSGGPDIDRIDFRCEKTDLRRPVSPKGGVKNASGTSDAPKVKQPLTPVAVRSKYKGARVTVNGRMDPRYLYQIGNGGGLKLPPGTHSIVFTNEGCEPRKKQITIVPNKKRKYSLIYVCKHIPAILTVRSTDALKVFDQKENYLGMTNSPIKVAMSETSRSLRLTIGPRSGKFLRKTAMLRAGKASTVNVD
ncbi:MAG: serine/threonine-protein kinase [Myxococcota bacterium]|nr:serine/threonine-protein kinase [Myxococcota bacterium]